MSQPATRVWRPGRPVHLPDTLGPLCRGPSDPTTRVEPSGAVWLAMRLEPGPATLRLGLDGAAGAVRAEAWGPAATAALDGVPDLLGARDDAEGFEPRVPLLARLAAQHPGLRVPRAGRVLEVLLPLVLEQKVTGLAARRAWGRLVRRFGEPAPGPEGGPALMLQPDPSGWARVPSWEWHRAGVEPFQAATAQRAVRRAAALERTLALPLAEVDAALRSLPGVGAWTAAEVRQRAHGDPDAVSVGDYHLPALVGWALAGREVDDDGMLELLAPWAGHRHRVVRLVELSGLTPPRRAPRMAVPDYRAI